VVEADAMIQSPCNPEETLAGVEDEEVVTVQIQQEKKFPDHPCVDLRGDHHDLWTVIGKVLQENRQLGQARNIRAIEQFQLTFFYSLIKLDLRYIDIDIDLVLDYLYTLIQAGEVMCHSQVTDESRKVTRRHNVSYLNGANLT